MAVFAPPNHSTLAVQWFGNSWLMHVAVFQIRWSPSRHRAGPKNIFVLKLLLSTHLSGQ